MSGSEIINSVMKRGWPEKLQLATAGVLQVLILALVVGALRDGKWLVTFTGVVVLALSFAPALIERQLHVQLPVELTLANCLFLYGSYGLGEVSQFYARYPWWDLMLHSVSAMIMGLIGFLLIYVFYMTKRIQMRPAYVAVATFCFAVTVGTLWEAFEFFMDYTFDFNMQKSGLVDTMTDLLINIVGAFVAALLGFFYVRGGDSLIADRLVRRFVANNPQLFSAGDGD